MNSIFRNALCAGIYYDYDISNAQPTILKFILNKSGYNTQLLDEYIKTKDKILNINFLKILINTLKKHKII